MGGAHGWESGCNDGHAMRTIGGVELQDSKRL